jgi:predicted transcriptional regulator
MVGGTPFTDRELDIMSVLWRLGSGTVSEVREALSADLGYTGVLKMLQILEEKEMVRHESEGRAYRYFPVVEPADAGGAALRRVVDKIFQGSAEMAIARLVSQHRLRPEEVARMKSLLDDAAGRDEEDGGPADDEGGEEE